MLYSSGVTTNKQHLENILSQNIFGILPCMLLHQQSYTCEVIGCKGDLVDLHIIFSLSSLIIFDFFAD